jgi:hypothetical protein
LRDQHAARLDAGVLRVADGVGLAQTLGDTLQLIAMALQAPGHRAPHRERIARQGDSAGQPLAEETPYLRVVEVEVVADPCQGGAVILLVDEVLEQRPQVLACELPHEAAGVARQV